MTIEQTIELHGGAARLRVRGAACRAACPGTSSSAVRSKRLMVFAGRSHPELAQRIAEQLGVELGDVELKSFANDETYVRYTSRSAAPTSSSSRRAPSRSTAT